MSKNILKLALILSAGVIIISGSVFFLTRGPKAVYQYDQVKVGKIVEAVTASGLVVPADSIDLSFERSGKINKINVAVGDQVVAGQVLLSLDNTEAAAQLAQAQAALNKQLAGNRTEYIAQLQAAVDQAEANLNQTQASSDNSVHAAEAVKLTAENNLKLAAGGESSQIVNDAYDNAAALLPAIQNTLTNSLTKADNILAVDNTSANDSFKNLLSVENLSRLSSATDQYKQTKVGQQDFTQAIALAGSDHGKIDSALLSADAALAATQDLLSDVSAVLDNTITGDGLNSAGLDALKTSIQSARADAAAKYVSLTDQKHALVLAKNSYTTYQIAFDKATQDLVDIKNKTTADLAAAQANLDKAKAVLADAKNPSREVDLAGFRAAVSLAAAEYGKTILLAPMAGVVSAQDGKLGALATPGVPLVSIISNSKYQAEIYVSELDLPKIKIGDSAVITLDNLGSGTEFSATVIKINPAAEKMANGNSAYKVTLQFTKDDERLKSGLSANVKIVGATKDNALLIPAGDVVQKDGGYFVMVKNPKNILEEKKIDVGLKGEDGAWEITSGLQANDLVASFSSKN